LRARVLDGGGGATAFTDWFDSKLGVNCAFYTASDGKLRCLPEGSSEFYTDAQCTQVIGLVGCGTPPPYVQVQKSYPPGSACPSTTQTDVYAIGNGGPFTPSAEWDVTSGTCTALSSTYYAPVVAYPTEVPSSTFVAATTTKLVPFGDGTLAARVLEADDGASQVVAITVTTTGVDCAPLGGFGRDSPYADLCVPNLPEVFAGIYFDSACTKLAPYISIPRSACPVAPLGDAGASLVFTAACSTPSPFVAPLGMPTVVPGFYGGVGSNCSPLAAGSTVVPYGPLAPTTAFPALRLQKVGTGRLRVESYVDDLGQPLVERLENMSPPFFDTQLGELCSPQSFADGTRCAPTESSITTYSFADPQCTTLLAFVDGAPGGCTQTPPVPANTAVPSGVGCASVQKTYAVGARTTPTTVYSQNGSGCMAGAPSSPGTYYSLTLRDDTVWPPLTARTE